MNSSIAINKIRRVSRSTVVEFIHFRVHAETCPIEISGPSVSLLYNWTPDKNITSQDLMVSCHGMAFGSMLFEYLEYSSIWNSILVLSRFTRSFKSCFERIWQIKIDNSPFLFFFSFLFRFSKVLPFFGWIW